MASYLDKTQVNTAITENTKLDLGHAHVSTSDFMQLNVSYLHEMVPGEKIDINMETFARLNPMPVPTFGRASMRHRAYFVPFRTVFRGWNDFITDAVHIPSDGTYNPNLLSTVPTVDMSELCRAFTLSIGQSPDGANMLYQVSGAEGDVQLPGANVGEYVYYNYTVRGRQAVKLLEQLGYKLDYSAKAGDCVLSALPLLALAKCYIDWMYPQQYSNVAMYDVLLSLCNYDLGTGPLALTASEVRQILEVCSYVQYDSDYFVSAFDFANSPSFGNYSSDFKLVNIDRITQSFSEPQSASVTYPSTSAGYVSNNSGNATLGNAIGGADAPFISPVTAVTSNKVALTPVSEYLLHSLHALTDYLKRHQLAGSRAFDRYLARFGKALAAEKMNRSVYLGAGVQNIQIGDIMSTSDTEGAQLGAFAGKGMSYGNSHFEYGTDEYGYLIIVSSIVPASGYYQGIDRQVMRTTKLQYFTPEFDSLGNQPITASELYIPQYPSLMSNTTQGNSAYNQIFGFAPRYADYKVAHDQLTGNFRLLSLNGGTPWLNAADSWHLMRTFNGLTDFYGNYDNVVHSPTFVSGNSDFSQYKRVFYDNESTAPDNFTVISNFEIAAYVPMKALYDSYEFEDKGKKVTLEVNGVKHN